jgi:hypothetical protein
MNAPHTLSAWIEGVGLVAPGMPDWASGAEVLAGRMPFQSAPSVLPAPLLLPPAERRRASRVVRVALASGLAALEHAGIDAATVPAIFSASTADGHNCHALCETLASDDHRVSPTRFHNSLHNTPAGYWSIATGAMSASQSLCAYDSSFSAGLLEALVQAATSQTPVLLVAYDAEYPEPLFAARPIPDAAGVGLVLSPVQTPRSLARISVALSDTAPDTLADPALDTLRSAIPALRGLPLLGLLAAGGSGCIALEYLAPLSLSVSLDRC